MNVSSMAVLGSCDPPLPQRSCSPFFPRLPPVLRAVNIREFATLVAALIPVRRLLTGHYFLVDTHLFSIGANPSLASRPRL